VGFRDTVVNIIGFGAPNRVRKRVLEYEGVQLQVQRAYDALESKRVAVNGTLEDLVAAKTAGIRELKKLSRISENLEARGRQVTQQAFDQAKLDVPLDRIRATISAADLAMGSAKGAGVGISTALGTWALVGTFGTASTGTAIGGLTGAAATNATLAWLGGGSIASGGLGMAGGTVVLGGIVLIPLLVIMGVFSHLSANKKIKEIEEATAKALAAIGQYMELTLTLEAVDRRAGEVSRSIRKATGTFQNQFRATYRALFPFGFLSRAFRYARRFLGGKYFSEDDLRHISPLLQIAAGMAELIDVRILDETGNLT
jgi:hypothetical protein